MDEKQNILSKNQTIRRVGRAWGKTVDRRTPRDTATGLAAALVGFLLGGCALPFSTYPLGLALLCASTKHTLAVAAGLLAAAFTLPLSPWISASVVVGTLLVRIAARVFVDLPVRIGGDGRRGELLEHLRGRMFCEGLYLRMAAGAVAVFAMGLYAVIRGGFRYYDLFGALFSMVIAPLSVFLFAGLFEGEYGRLFSSRFASPLGVLSRIALATALSYALRGTDLAGVSLALAFSFFAVITLCRRNGLLAAILAAAATGAAVGLPYPMVLLAVAFIAFLCAELPLPFSASAACLAGTVCGVLILGKSAAVSLLLPLLSGAAVVGVSDKLSHSQTAPPSAIPVGGRDAREYLLATRTESEGLVEALASLSDTLLQEPLPQEEAEAIALSYGTSATLLRELSARLDEGFTEDRRLSASVTERLSALGYTAASVSITGTRQRSLRVTGLSPMPAATGLDYLGGQLSRVSGISWQIPSLAGDGTLTAERAPILRVCHGSYALAKEEVCGHVISVFRDRERGFFYALLNDGMGAGKEAAETARLGALFFQRLLPAGVRPETILRMLNRFLRQGRNGGDVESSTTVDLLAVDLLLGHASFLKSGSAPTYVKRGKNIFYVDAKTAPVGILREIDAKQIDFDLKAGDVIVMVSDGVTGGENECLWLLNLLDATEETDPTTLARQIVDRAARESEPDDLSAILLRVDPA